MRFDPKAGLSMSTFADKASLLNVMSNAARLHILTILLAGEMGVGQLAGLVGLSQSALSQHLGKLRAAGLVITRRNAQAVFYSINSDKAAAILCLLESLFEGENQSVKLFA
jgi:DNA-binding transcriptional ArsR family regulator